MCGGARALNRNVTFAGGQDKPRPLLSRTRGARALESKVGEEDGKAWRVSERRQSLDVPPADVTRRRFYRDRKNHNVRVAGVDVGARRRESGLLGCGVATVAARGEALFLVAIELWPVGAPPMRASRGEEGNPKRHHHGNEEGDGRPSGSHTRHNDHQHCIRSASAERRKSGCFFGSSIADSRSSGGFSARLRDFAASQATGSRGSGLLFQRRAIRDGASGVD